MSSHAKHRLTVDVWGTMSAAQREKASRACFTLPAPPSSTSTDGSMTVPLTSLAGKKPHQRKRNRAETWCIEESMAERTTTVSAKKPRPGFSSSTTDVINDQSDDDVA